jgi:hypothetical protein
MVSWNRVADLLHRLEKAGLDPKPEPFTAVRDIDWEALPPTVDSRTLLQGRRLQQKRDQVANLLALVRDFPATQASLTAPLPALTPALSQGERGRPPRASPDGHPGAVRVRLVAADFGAGSGHLSLPLAYLHPGVTVWLIDVNGYALDLARQRAEAAGLANVRFFAGPVAEFAEPFHLGFALHACGPASDEAQERCLEHGATYVICPCDLGQLQHSPHPYPRSARFRKNLTRDEYDALASAADWTNSDDPSRREQGARAMAYVNLDRNLAAEEVGYETLLLLGYPLQSTPKNQVLYGSRPGKLKLADLPVDEMVL